MSALVAGDWSSTSFDCPPSSSANHVGCFIRRADTTASVPWAWRSKCPASDEMSALVAGDWSSSSSPDCPPSSSANHVGCFIRMSFSIELYSLAAMRSECLWLFTTSQEMSWRACLAPWLRHSEVLRRASVRKSSPSFLEPARSCSALRLPAA